MQFRGRSSLRGGLANHVRGQVRNAAAKSRPGLEPAVVLVDRVDECDTRYKAALKKRGRRPGTRPKPCVDLVFAGPRIDIGPWVYDHALAWATDCVAFVERRVGPECVALAVLHTDEGAFHAHIHVSCCVSGKPLGSDAVRKAMADGYAETVRLRKPHRRELRAIVDAYQAEVGRRWGFVDPDRAVNVRPRRIDVTLARRLRIEDHLILARIQLARIKAHETKNATNEAAWARRVDELQIALDNDDFSVVTYSADSEDPVPVFSTAVWAQSLRIEEDLALAESALSMAGERQALNAMDGPDDPDNSVAAEITAAWIRRVDELQNAVDNDDFSGLTHTDHPVPGYSALAWAKRRKEIRNDAEIEAEAAWDPAEPPAIENPGNPAAALAERAEDLRNARSRPK